MTGFSRYCNSQLWTSSCPRQEVDRYKQLAVSRRRKSNGIGTHVEQTAQYKPRYHQHAQLLVYALRMQCRTDVYFSSGWYETIRCIHF